MNAPEDRLGGSNSVTAAMSAARPLFHRKRKSARDDLLFVISLGFFTISLVDLAREVRIALHEYDHYK